MTSIFEGTQPPQNKAFSTNQNKGPHLGSSLEKTYHTRNCYLVGGFNPSEKY